MRTLTVIIVAVLAGCSLNAQSGPQAVMETSTARPQLKDRVEFIEQYVTFKRDYLKLEYDVMYRNNSGGMVPGPSDWDIKILAVVPTNKIDAWIPPGGKSTVKRPPKWLTAMPANISTTNVNVTEWYQASGVEIGVDRSTSTIAYRNTTLLGD
jgi:hypothetical protein